MSIQPVEERIGEALYIVMRSVREHMKQMIDELGLTHQQMVVLHLLDHPIPMGALAERLSCDASNITGLADRLEQRGLVERRGSKGDRRVKLLARTEIGERLFREAHSNVWSTAPALLGLTDEQRHQLVGLLEAAAQSSVTSRSIASHAGPTPSL